VRIRPTLRYLCDPLLQWIINDDPSSMLAPGPPPAKSGPERIRDIFAVALYKLTFYVLSCLPAIGYSIPNTLWIDGVMPRLHLIHVVSICIPCRCLHVSCIGDKIVVTATCIHLYPRVEHCLELVSVDIVDGYKLLVRDTCIRSS